MFDKLKGSVIKEEIKKAYNSPIPAGTAALICIGVTVGAIILTVAITKSNTTFVVIR